MAEKNRRRLDPRIIILFCLLGGVFALRPPPAGAIELIPYAALTDVTPLSGCCQRQAATPGFGVLAHIPKLHPLLGDVELDGFSDFKFSEASIAKYLYLVGSGPQLDPSSTKEMRIMKYSQFTTTFSFGLGFFSHNTNTTLYNLPTLVTGAQAVSRVILSYTVNDVWSVSTMAKGGLGYSNLETIFYIGFGLGASFRF